MSSSTKKESLADKISDLLSAAPVSFDPEDDVHDETTAKTVEPAPEDEDFEDEGFPTKRRIAAFPLEEDERYSGRTVSRKRLGSSEEDESSEVESEEASDDESEEESKAFDEERSEEEIEGADDESREDVEFEHMKSADVSAEMKKGASVRNQINIWEGILEMRIQLQKCLLAANKMPQKEKFRELAENESEFDTKAKEVQGSVTDLLEKFLVLQSLLLSQYPETKSLLNKGKVKETESKHVNDEDEEIPSDDEVQDTKDDIKKNGSLHRAKRRKLEYYKDNLKTFHDKYKPYRNSVIQKWNDRTRILQSKSTETTSILNQIQYTLSDRAKLIKRTQLKRSNYEILGETNDEEYNKEIFDDDDFYHQLLRELIEFRSADITDPVQLSRQWIQLQNFRSKMKRNVDTRATKGRKIRYTVHPKLVNFMAPIDNSSWSEEAKNDLFKSLFRSGQVSGQTS